MERNLLWIMVSVTLLVVSGCSGSSSDGNGPVPQPQGMLSLVSDPADLEQSIKAGLTTVPEAEGTQALALGAPAAAPGADTQSGNFTGTYTQEANVDEFDAVRYDGSHLFIAPRRYLYCCFIALPAEADGAVNTGSDPVASIRILATDPAGGTASEVGSIPLEQGISVQGMYKEQDRLFALTAESFYGGYGDFWADVAIWAPEQFGYRVYDVSDPAAPAIEADVSIDGVIVESRRIGNTVYIVSRYTPFINNLVYNVTTVADQANNDAILQGVTLDELLPTITINGNTSSLVDPTLCYLPTTAADVGYPVITSITAVPIDNPTNFRTTCYNEEAYGAYVSENAIYFTQIKWDAQETSTRIHKFAFSGSGLDYRGSADIDGQVWRGGQADFRMSESGDNLRVLASDYDWTTPDFVDHKLFILRENPARPELEIVSELPNANRPEEIGKPNEALFGVRFLDDRAYAVTFERIDPLYVLDLADATDPFIAGELQVTGFSDFLHPVTDDLLLGLGTAGNGGIKVELFDVSDIADPLSRGQLTLGERGSYSEATYDRHAFTYQSDVNGVDRFTIPANVYTSDGITASYTSALYLFEIHNKMMPNLASLLSVGSIGPPADPTRPLFWNPERNRAFIHDDTVFYIQNEDVWSAFWNAPTMVNGPF